MYTGNHSVSGETVFPPVYTIHVYLHAYTNIMGANGNPAVHWHVTLGENKWAILCPVLVI